MGDIALLLVGVEYPVNLGQCLRTAETAGLGPVYLHDSHSLLQTSKGRHMVKRVSRGAFSHKGVVKVQDPYGFLSENEAHYRRIATVIDDPEAKVLGDFGFLPGDLLVFGEEDQGIGKYLVELCDERVTIPRFCPSQCYPLISALSMFAQEYLGQLLREGKLEPIEDYTVLPKKAR